MGKIDLLSKVFSEMESGDDKSDDFVREFGDLVCNFMKTGVESVQLEKYAAREERFREAYESQLSVKEIACRVSKEGSKKAVEVLEAEMVQNPRLENAIAALSDRRRKPANIFVEVSEKINTEIVDIVNKYLSEAIREVSYFSHLNMLYDLYRKEMKIRREEKEFGEVSKKSREVVDIVQRINQNRRMALDQLQEEMALAPDRVMAVLTVHSKYFNIYEKQEGIQVSLSPLGKKFCQYVKNSSKRYSQKTMEQLVYKNCDRLMEAIENRCDWDFGHYIQFENLPPEMERSLQHRYDRIAKKIRPDRDMDYGKSEYIIWDMERKKNEADKFRGIRRWGQEDY